MFGKGVALLLEGVVDERMLLIMNIYNCIKIAIYGT